MKIIIMILIFISTSTDPSKKIDFTKDIGAYKLEQITISTFDIK